MRMYCLSIKKYQILIIFYAIIFSSCKKSEENNYIFSGIVTDQVTGQTVSGASVSLVTKMSCEVNAPNSRFGPGTISSLDGKFRISVPIETYENRIIGYGCPSVYAWKSGYVGSFSGDASSPGANNLNIKLVHYGKLNLYVKNDTINNNIDSVEIRISRWGFGGHNYHEYSKICRGRKFDRIIQFDSLWSATSYGIQIGTIGRSIFSVFPQFEGAIFINPDIATEYSVIF